MKRRLVALLDKVGLLSTAVGLKRVARTGAGTARRRWRAWRTRDRFAHVAGEGRRVVTAHDWPLVTEPATTFDPLADRAANLDRVLLACARAEATHFVSRAEAPGRSRAGVVGPVRGVLETIETDASGGMVAIERQSTIAGVAPASAAMSIADELRPGDLILLFRPIALPDGALHDGLGTACELETWTTEDPDSDTLVTQAPNPVSRQMNVEGDGRLDVPEFGWLGDDWAPPFEIDVVYTWVDGTDPAWIERQREFRPVDAASDGATAERFEPFDELRYSLRSLRQHVPFVRRIFLVTDRQRPEWLLDDAGVAVVDHSEIFRPVDALPVFNSHAIESQLHHVPGLAEHYVYLNDDVFFGRNVPWTTFFTVGGLARFAESRARIPIRPLGSDPAVDHSGANAQRLLFELVGRAPSRKIKHTPHPQIRSVHEELERRIPDVYERVARSRFRSVHDISLAVLFHHRYGEATGRAIPGRYDYDYLNLSRADLPALLDQLAVRRPTTFCLNDAALPSDRRSDVRSLLQRHLAAMFPVAAPWEKHSRHG
ncbi:MAG: hypothetical protein HKN41_01725 [Ilumatobacter sp.]|nr:hypothetical protein [Ilumatobacter sp.]